jgi:hypothetical protein
MTFKGTSLQLPVKCRYAAALWEEAIAAAALPAMPAKPVK